MASKKESFEMPTLRLTALWQKDGPKSGGILRKTELGDFPDVDAAALFLRVSNPVTTWPYLLCYRLEPTPDYRGGYSDPVTIFDPDGNLCGGFDHDKTDCFPGRMPEECRFKRGDIVMFAGYRKLILGVVEELPPAPAFAQQVSEENGMLDSIDDAYMVLHGKGGKDHSHPNECELFLFDGLVPKYIAALQKAVVTNTWRSPADKISDFYVKSLFLNWLSTNKYLFSHEPYIDKEGAGYFNVLFEGITRQIVCRFSESGAIEVRVFYRNQFYDIIMEFDLHEEETPTGRYLCSSCRDWQNENDQSKVIEYDSRDELWIKHSFEPLADYVREEFTDDALLCLFRYSGCTTAFVANGERLEKLRKRDDFFKEIPVVVKQ
jgi:hypothetical protein